MRNWLMAIVGLWWWSGGPPAAADVLHLTSGRRLEGVVVEDAGLSVKVRVTWLGYVTMDRGSIRAIERSDAADRERLLDGMRQQFVADQERQQAQAAFEAAQRAKGLVKRQGRWLTPEELAQSEATAREEQAREERARFEEAARRAEAAVGRLEARLDALERENRRLRVELSRRRVLVTDGVLVRHPRRSVARDEHGNLLRIHTHDDHRFLTLPDGRHADLEERDSRLTFTDEAGVLHELHPVR